MMKHLVLLAGVAALCASVPGLAKPGMGHGFGNPHGNPHDLGIGFRGRPAGPVGYGAGGCPPGLAKKAVPCVPPGLAKQQFGMGARIPSSFGTLLAYSALPHHVRTRYSSRLSPRDRYFSSNGYLYGVNPRTRTVQSVIRVR